MKNEELGMTKGKREEGKVKKEEIKKRRLALVYFSLFTILFSLIACDSPFNSKDNPEGYGKVRITFAGGNARTVFPEKVFNYV